MQCINLPNKNIYDSMLETFHRMFGETTGAYLFECEFCVIYVKHKIYIKEMPYKYHICYRHL